MLNTMAALEFLFGVVQPFKTCKNHPLGGKTRFKRFSSVFEDAEHGGGVGSLFRPLPTPPPPNKIRGRKLDRFSRSMRLSKLYPDTKYLICVVALGNWAFNFKEIAPQILHRSDNYSHDLEIFTEAIRPLLVDSPTSRCAEVNTLGAPDSMHVGMGILPDHSMGAQSILTRRLGLIIGCCMGFVVFVVLVSILGYLKVKKQRRAVKRDQPLPPEYLSYRHFSIQSGEAGGHPHFITNMNTTVLN